MPGFFDPKHLGDGVSFAVVSVFYAAAAQALLLLPIEAALVARDRSEDEPAQRVRRVLLAIVALVIGPGVAIYFTRPHWAPFPIASVPLALVGPIALLIAESPSRVGPRFGALLRDSFLASGLLGFVVALINMMEHVVRIPSVYVGGVSGATITLAIGVAGALLASAFRPADATSVDEEVRPSFVGFVAYFAAIVFAISVGVAYLSTRSTPAAGVAVDAPSPATSASAAASTSSNGPAPSAATPSAPTANSGPSSTQAKSVAVFDIVAKLADAEAAHYVRISFFVVFDSEAHAAALRPRQSELRDLSLRYLSDVKLADMLGEENMKKREAELLTRIKQVSGGESAQRILLQGWVTQ
jgi:flagellar basal body-associated protein FliL